MSEKLVLLDFTEAEWRLLQRRAKQRDMSLYKYLQQVLGECLAGDKGPCETVTLRDENARLREQREALAEALAEVFRETEHINTRRGSRNGRIREVAEAALRVYKEARDE